MTKTVKIHIKRNTRTGRTKPLGLLVISLPEETSNQQMQEVVGVLRSTITIQYQRHEPILTLFVKEPAQVKFYRL